MKEFEFDQWCEMCNLFFYCIGISHSLYVSLFFCYLYIMRITIDESQCGITGVSRLLFFLRSTLLFEAVFLSAFCVYDDERGSAVFDRNMVGCCG